MYCKKNVHPGELEKENRQAEMKRWQEAQGCGGGGGGGGGGGIDPPSSLLELG